MGRQGGQVSRQTNLPSEKRCAMFSLLTLKRLGAARRSRPRSTPRSATRCRRRLEVERLEDRQTPAATIPVLAPGVGPLDAPLLANAGPIPVNDGDVGGTGAETLSRAALETVAAAANIDVAARTAITFNTGAGATLLTA